MKIGDNLHVIMRHMTHTVVKELIEQPKNLHQFVKQKH